MEPTRRGGKPPLSFRERFGALKNLPEFFRLIWQTNPKMVLVNVLLRIIRAAIPLVTLYVAKLIIDEVIRVSQSETQESLNYLFTLVGVEFLLAIFFRYAEQGHHLA